MLRRIIIATTAKLFSRWVKKYIVNKPVDCHVKINMLTIDLIFGHDNRKDKNNGKRKPKQVSSTVGNP